MEESKVKAVTRLDVKVEKQVLMGMITSTPFLKRIANVVKAEYLELDIGRVVVSWVLDYWSKYGRAPGARIQEVFEDKTVRMKDAEKEWLQDFLQNLSDEYERGGYNEDYLFDRCIKYFRRQRLQLHLSQVEKLLVQGKVDEAEEVWIEARTVPESDDMGVEVFSKETARQIFYYDVNVRAKMKLNIPTFDELTGWLMSEWFIMFMGPKGRGKTAALIHTAVQAAVQGLNVVFYSLESGKSDTCKKLWMNFGSLTLEGKGSYEDIAFPKFLSKREDEFDVSLAVVTRPRAVHRAVAKVIDAFHFTKKAKKKTKCGRLMLKIFPAYTAGVKDIKHHLNLLDSFDDFLPHVILVDYVGILAAPTAYRGRDAYDYNTKMLKGLSEERKAIVFSATQGTRATLKKRTMTAIDVPEDIRQIANVDVMLGLNQVEEEGRENKMRLNVISHRYRKASPYVQSLILQQMEAGQFCLNDKRWLEIERETKRQEGKGEKLEKEVEGDED